MIFNVAEVTQGLIDWTKYWFEQNGKGCKAIIGISGGKDSTVAAAICVRALGTDRVVGILMPNGTQKDIDDARRVVEFLGITSYEANIFPAYHEICKLVDEFIPITKQTTENLAPRIRMATLYAFSQSLNGRVINTCNLSENMVGFSTLYGDHAGDVSLFDQLTVTEIKAIGHFLELPDDLVDKTPSDGLCGKTDEDAIGFSYEVLDKFIRTGICEDNDTFHSILAKFKNSEFKFNLIQFPHYDPGLSNHIYDFIS